MTTDSNMKSKTKAPSDGESRPGPVHATLTFELPAAEEMLESAVQARKWKQVVKDLTLIVCEWRDTARTPAEGNAFRSVNLILRDYLADAGLTLYPREQLDQMRDERLEQYRKHLDTLFNEATARWRNMMGKLPEDPEDEKQG